MKDKEYLEVLKKIKFSLENLINHNYFNFMTLNLLGYSCSLKDYFNILKVKKDLRKLDKQIKLYTDRVEK